MNAVIEGSDVGKVIRQGRASVRHHVAFVVNNYPPKVGGVESHVSHLAASLVEQDVDVTVFALDNEVPSGLHKGIEVVRYRGSFMIGGVLSLPWLGTGKKLRAELRRRNITVISTHTRFFPMSFLGVRAAKRLGLPVIHTEHGSDHVRGVSKTIGLASRLVDLTMGRYILRNATRALAISSAAQRFVGSLAQVECDIFHNAIDTKAFRATHTAVRQPVPRLVFLGRLVEGKGWQTCLLVAESLAPEFPNLELHFIGDGTQRRLLEEAAARSTIAGKITLHGYVDRDEIVHVLGNSVLLNPTTLAEGFQTTLLEAVSSGAAVVSTPVAAAIFLAERGAPVSIVEEASPSAWIRECRNVLLKPLSKVSAELTNSFDWQTRSQQYVEVIDFVTASRSSASQEH